jgi:hypothetical protein
MTSSCGPLPRRAEGGILEDPPAVLVTSGQQDGCGSCAARTLGGNERQGCHRGDRGKHDYSDEERSADWNAGPTRFRHGPGNLRWTL